MRRRNGTPWWSELDDDELLDLPMSKLGLSIDGTPLEGRVAQLMEEIEAAGLRFRPRVWLSTDWFSPHGVPGFAIPFYLAHPRLARLERGHMVEVEGGNHEWCMKLLRHEAGHAVSTAYRLHHRKCWRDVFGRASEPYRPSYRPRPRSRDHVRNLDGYYAQSHPMEDFAETFAVWLRPGRRWRSRYKGWPALGKLEFVEEMMNEIADRAPVVCSQERVDSLPQTRMTLREYYRRKIDRYESGRRTAGRHEYFR